MITKKYDQCCFLLVWVTMTNKKTSSLCFRSSLGVGKKYVQEYGII